LNKCLNFSGDPVTDPDTHLNLDPYSDTSKTCLGEGMPCPSAFTLCPKNAQGLTNLAKT